MRQADAFLLAVLLAAPAGAQQQPLSAIDWLDDPVPLAEPRRSGPSTAAVPDTLSVPDIEVLPLGESRPDAVGLLPGNVTGLPDTLWSASSGESLADLWSGISLEPLPAIQALYYTLLLAEADPPPGEPGGNFLRVRVDRLKVLGAVEPAIALLERADPATPELFDAWFDLTLLSGGEGRACAALRRQPSLSPGHAARIYCAARVGDWNTAELVYRAVAALGMLEPRQARLLERFLYPGLIEGAPSLAPPRAPTPLEFRLYEALGAPLPTHGLPRAYAVADLRAVAGWKARLEAAERLARTGALSSNRLLGLYTERRAAASGGVWQRVAAIQALDEALAGGDTAALPGIVEEAWRAMKAVHLEIPFAELFAARIARFDLPPGAATLAWKIRLLSDDYEAAAEAGGNDRRARFLSDVARGAPSFQRAETALEQSIAEGFAAHASAPAERAILDQGRLGEAILRAADRLDKGHRGTGDIASALATLRAVGLEETARRAALQLLILERRR